MSTPLRHLADAAVVAGKNNGQPGATSPNVANVTLFQVGCGRGNGGVPTNNGVAAAIAALQAIDPTVL